MKESWFFIISSRNRSRELDKKFHLHCSIFRKQTSKNLLKQFFQVLAKLTKNIGKITGLLNKNNGNPSIIHKTLLWTSLTLWKSPNLIYCTLNGLSNDCTQSSLRIIYVSELTNQKTNRFLPDSKIKSSI